MTALAFINAAIAGYSPKLSAPNRDSSPPLNVRGGHMNIYISMIRRLDEREPDPSEPNICARGFQRQSLGPSAQSVSSS